jgi:hypothetical protein
MLNGTMRNASARMSPDLRERLLVEYSVINISIIQQVTACIPGATSLAAAAARAACRRKLVVSMA